MGKGDCNFVINVFKYVGVSYHGFQPNSKGEFMGTNVFEQRGSSREVTVGIYKGIAQRMPSLNPIQQFCCIRAGVRIPNIDVSNVLDHIKELARIKMTCDVDVCRSLRKFRHCVLVEVRWFDDLG